MYLINDSKFDQSNDGDLQFKDGENRPPKKPRNFNFNKNTLVTFGGAILLGIVVYLLTSMMFNGGKNDNSTTNSVAKDIDLNNKIVQRLYGYVTYGDYDIFEKNMSVKLDNLSNYDKFYYASALIKEKDIEELQTTQSNTKIPSISQSRINDYMELLFGSKVKFEKDVNISLIFNFYRNDKNIVNCKYNSNMTSYSLDFVGKKEITNTSNDYYTELSTAKVLSNGDLQIVEKILYTDVKYNGNKVNYSVYKDYNKTMLIDSKSDVSKELFTLKDVMNANKSKVTKVIFTFKKDKEKNNNYYFYSSKIKIN